MNRDLPNNTQVEGFLLCCCMLDGSDVVGQCIAAKILPTSFYDQKHAIVFSAIMDLYARALPVDTATVATELGRSDALQGVGGYGFLVQISSYVPTTAQAKVFIAEVKRLATLRAMIRGASALIEKCYETTDGNIATELGRDLSLMGNLLTSQAAPREWKVVVEEAKAITVERMKPRAERTQTNFELGWGFDDLDYSFQRMELGELVVIAARTSTGKSSFMRQVTFANARAGHGVLVESLEVTDTEAAINYAANISGIRSRKFLDQLHHADQAQLLSAFDALKLDNLSVCHLDKSLAEIKARAKAFKAQRGLKMLAIDFLGLIEDAKYPMRGERIDQAIGRVTGDLKQFAVSESIVVVLLVQLNRAVELDGRPPMLSDLRDSGRIEEDANRVIFLHRPREYTIGTARFQQSDTADISDLPRFYVEAIQAKGRNHGTGSVGLSFDRATATFRQIARS